jgi:hypothetical protein
LAISKTNSSKYGDFGPFFPKKLPVHDFLPLLFIYLFILQSGENSPPKKALIPDV